VLARERLDAILSRKPIDRLPVDIWHTPEIGEVLRRHTGSASDLEMYRALNLDKIVWTFIDYANDSEGHGDSQADVDISRKRTMWGTPVKDIQSGSAIYEEFGEAPLLGYDDPASLDSYPHWPNPNNFDYVGVIKQAREVHAEFLVLGPWISLLEIYCQMRGIEQAMIDIASEPLLVEAILDRIESIQTKMLHKLFNSARSYFDLVFISDDIGTQNGLFISPTAWQRHLQPRMKRWCDLIHSYGLKAFYHTDGAVEPLISDFIDCGIDVLNPIQHICAGMDTMTLKKKYGSKIIFHGGVDNQHVLPFGTSDEVRAEVRMLCDTLGADKEGFICCSCHNIQAGTPLDNILAMIDEMKSR